MHMCDAEKKVGVTTSGTYKRGWDGTFLSHSLQGVEPISNPCEYRLLIIGFSLSSSVDAFCFYPPPPLFPASQIRLLVEFIHKYISLS